LDDCDRAATLLPSAAEDAVSKQAEQLANFFEHPAAPYIPQTFATKA
jgi:hypothetical protein